MEERLHRLSGCKEKYALSFVEYWSRIYYESFGLQVTNFSETRFPKKERFS